MIDKLVLLSEFFFIFRLEIFPAALQHMIVDLVGMFHAGKSVRRVFSVETVSRYSPLVHKFCFFFRKPVELRFH